MSQVQQSGAQKPRGSVARLAALYGGTVTPAPTAPELDHVMGVPGPQSPPREQQDSAAPAAPKGWQTFGEEPARQASPASPQHHQRASGSPSKQGFAPPTTVHHVGGRLQSESPPTHSNKPGIQHGLERGEMGRGGGGRGGGWGPTSIVGSGDRNSSNGHPEGGNGAFGRPLAGSPGKFAFPASNGRPTSINEWGRSLQQDEQEKDAGWQTFGDDADVVSLDQSPASSFHAEQPTSAPGAVKGPVDEKMDEAAVAEFHIQRTLLMCFGAIAGQVRRRRHIKGAGFTIAMTSRARCIMRCYLAWRIYSSRRAFVARKVNSMESRRESHRIYRQTTLHRASFVAWSAYARDFRRVEQLADSMFGKHGAREQMNVMDGWLSLVSLKRAGDHAVSSRQSRVQAQSLTVLRNYANNRVWCRAAVMCGRERASKLRGHMAIDSWAGWVRHVDHLSITGDRLERATRAGFKLNILMHWLDWSRACKRGDFIATVRILRGWCNAAAAASSVEMIGMMISEAHSSSVCFDTIKCWSRYASLSSAARRMHEDAAEARFAGSLIAWFRESHLRARLRRSSAVLKGRVSSQARLSAFGAWADYTRKCIVLRDMDGGFKDHIEGVVSGRVLRGWHAVAWRIRTLGRSESALRAKVARMVYSSCTERWSMYVIESHHKRKIKAQEKVRLARSASKVVLAAWQQIVLYNKYLRLGEDKVAAWTRFGLINKVFSDWRGVTRAGLLSRKLSMRRTTRGWKEGAWRLSCQEASKEVAMQYSDVKLLKSAVHGWDTYTREQFLCSDFREGQICASVMKGWKGEIARANVHCQVFDKLHNRFFLSAGSLRFAWLVKEWAMHVQSKMSRNAAAAPMIRRAGDRVATAALSFWYSWARRKRYHGEMAERMQIACGRRRALRAVDSWRGRVHYVRATTEGIDEGCQERSNELMSSAFGCLALSRHEMIQLTSAEQYVEEATANRRMLDAIQAWAGHAGYLAKLRDTEAIVKAGHEGRMLLQHIRQWSDAAVATGLGICVELKLGFSAWRGAAAAIVNLRMCEEELETRRAGWCAVTALRAWWIVAMNSQAVCSVTGIEDAREAQVRRWALSKLLKFWLGRVHTKAARRDICSAVAVRTERGFLSRMLQLWRVRATQLCSEKEAAEAVSIRCMMGLMYRSITSWRGVVRSNHSGRELKARLSAAYCEKLVGSCLTLWANHTRAQNALGVVKDAAMDMYAAKILAKSLALLARHRVWSQGKAGRWQRAVWHHAIKGTRRVFGPWKMRGMVWQRSVAGAMSKASFQDLVMLQNVAKAWWVVARVETRARDGLVLDSFIGWKNDVEEEVFERKAMPMAGMWCDNRLLTTVIREWLVAALNQQKYAFILQERAARERAVIIPAVIQAWFQLAVNNERMWECHDEIQVKMCHGVRGRMFAKWATCMYEGRFFGEAYYILFDRHEMRVILGVLRIWSDQVMRSEYKALINEKCDAYLAAKHKTRMTRTVRGWFQAVVVRDVTIQVIRKKQMQGVKPTWFTWRLATVQLLQLKRISERISANTRCNLQSRAWRGWVSAVALNRYLDMTEELISRRTDMSLCRHALVSWRREMSVLNVDYILTIRRTLYAWKVAVERIIWCEQAAWAHDMPRRVKVARAAVFAWRMHKERSIYHVVAVDTALTSKSRRCAKKALAAWSGHVGAVWPKRFASYSATSMAGVKTCQKHFIGWAKFVLTKIDQRRKAAVMGAEIESDLAMMVVREWCKAAAAAQTGKRGSMGRAWAGWSRHAERSIVAYGQRMMQQKRETASHFKAWWTHSARLGVIRGVMHSILAQLYTQAAVRAFSQWSIYSLKCSAADEHAERASLRLSLRGWHAASSMETIYRSVVASFRKMTSFRSSVANLRDWRDAAAESRRHRRAKKHIRKAAGTPMPDCFRRWRAKSAEKSQLNEVGLTILIEHNRMLAAGAFTNWLVETSHNLAKLSMILRSSRLSLLRDYLRDWFAWSSRRFYGDGAVVAHMSPPSSSSSPSQPLPHRNYGDKTQYPMTPSPKKSVRLQLPSPGSNTGSPTPFSGTGGRDTRSTPIRHGPGVSPPRETAAVAAAKAGGAAGAAAVLAQAIQKRQSRISADQQRDRTRQTLVARGVVLTASAHVDSSDRRRLADWDHHEGEFTDSFHDLAEKLGNSTRKTLKYPPNARFRIPDASHINDIRGVQV